VRTRLWNGGEREINASRDAMIELAAPG